MRLLIYLLALTSAFFISAEPDLTDLKPAKELGDSFCQFHLGNLKNVSLAECGEHVISKVKARPPYPTEVTLVLKELPTSPGNMWFEVDYDDGDGDGIDNGAIYTSNLDNPTYSCPPDGFSDYYIVVGEGSSMMCAKDAVPQDCPAGYHSKGVSTAMGSSDCMPKECPPEGGSESLYTSPNIGGSFSGGGTYCNDGCAYNVSSSNITSDKYATGRSLGAACGDKPYDTKKMADENDDSCSLSSDSNGVSLLTCANGNTDSPTPDDPNVNNDDSKSDDSEKPKDDLANCTGDDLACQMDNLKKQNSNDTKSKIENDNKNHNKLVDTLTKNTNAIKQSIDDFNIAFDITSQQSKRQKEVELSKLDQIITTLQAGNQIAIDKPVGGSGSGGTGTGQNDGTCVGDNCSDDSKYNGECEGDLCDLDIVTDLEGVDEDIINWFKETTDTPSEFTTFFTNITSLITSNFASFNGVCTPFVLDVSVGGSPKKITVNQHCEPYETYFKPLVEWLLWTLTAMTLFNMCSQVFRNFSHV